MWLGCEEGARVVLVEVAHTIETQAFVVNFSYALTNLNFIHCIENEQI